MAAGGKFDDVVEPPAAEMKLWLQQQGVADMIEEADIRRAYLAFTRCPFGPAVPPHLKTTFFRRLAPWVKHLAI